jgi:hypothetical protein
VVTSVQSGREFEKGAPQAGLVGMPDVYIRSSRLWHKMPQTLLIGPGSGLSAALWLRPPHLHTTSVGSGGRRSGGSGEGYLTLRG